MLQLKSEVALTSNAISSRGKGKSINICLHFYFLYSFFIPAVPDFCLLSLSFFEELPLVILIEKICWEEILLFFFSCENFLLAPSFLKDICTGYRILGNSPFLSAHEDSGCATAFWPPWLLVSNLLHLHCCSSAGNTSFFWCGS